MKIQKELLPILIIGGTIASYLFNIYSWTTKRTFDAISPNTYASMKYPKEIFEKTAKHPDIDYTSMKIEEIVSEISNVSELSDYLSELDVEGAAVLRTFEQTQALQKGACGSRAISTVESLADDGLPRIVLSIYNENGLYHWVVPYKDPNTGLYGTLVPKESWDYRPAFAKDIEQLAVSLSTPEMGPVSKFGLFILPPYLKYQNFDYLIVSLQLLTDRKFNSEMIDISDKYAPLFIDREIESPQKRQQKKLEQFKMRISAYLEWSDIKK